MIRDQKLLEQWYKKQLRKEALDFSRSLRLLEAMYEEARLLGAFPAQDRPDRLERKIRLAKIVNVSETAGRDSSSS